MNNVAAIDRNQLKKAELVSFISGDRNIVDRIKLDES